MTLERWLNVGCVFAVLCGSSAFAQRDNTASEKSLPDTQLLTESRPLDEVMVAGIDRFALKAISETALVRRALGNRTGEAIENIEVARQDFATRIGVSSVRFIDA